MERMKMREGAGWALLVIAILIWFGAHEWSRANDFRSKLNTAQAQILDLNAKVDELQEANDKLRDQMRR